VGALSHVPRGNRASGFAARSIPTIKIDSREVIDIERILKRRPQVVVIDGLAYSNPPGSRHAETLAGKS
jgi:K+-sensing histidine kinase KdpD